MATTDQATAQCPNCERPTAGEELRRFRGVCKFCFGAFRSANKTWVEGRDDPHRSHHRERAGVFAFDDAGAAASVDFDWNALDDNVVAIRGADDSARAQAAEVLSAVIRHCWNNESDASARMATACRRFVGISRALRPDLFPGHTHKDLACLLGITKQGLSKIVINAEEAFGMKFSTTRSERSRKRMAKAQKGHGNYHRIHRERMAAPTPGKESFSPAPPDGSDRTRSFPHA